LGEQAAQEQKKRSEMMHRILDLRNASKKGIEVTNRQRVIDEFGRKEPGKGTDTGSSEVQGEPSSRQSKHGSNRPARRVHHPIMLSTLLSILFRGLSLTRDSPAAALLTQKIRSLAEHIHSNPRDNSNMRALKMLVLERARVLKYFKRKHPEEAYDTLLTDLGLQRRAVEGELFF
jgi:small subunit ribosomal protein S15